MVHSFSRAERSFAFLTAAHRTARSFYLPCQQFADRVVDEFGVFGLEHRVAGAVAPERRDGPQLGAWHTGHLAPVIRDREIEIGVARHDNRIGSNRPKGLVKIAIVKL